MWSCGCWNEDPVLTFKCGGTLSKSNRKIFCGAVKPHTTYLTDCCSLPMCQVRRFAGREWRCCKCNINNRKDYNCSAWPQCHHACCQKCTQGTLPVASPDAPPGSLQGIPSASGGPLAAFSPAQQMPPIRGAGATGPHSIQEKGSAQAAGAAPVRGSVPIAPSSRQAVRPSSGPLPIRPTPRRATAPNKSISPPKSNQDIMPLGYHDTAAPTPCPAPSQSLERKPQPLDASTRTIPNVGYGRIGALIAGAAPNDVQGHLSGQITTPNPAPSTLLRPIPRVVSTAVSNKTHDARSCPIKRLPPPDRSSDLPKWGIRKRRSLAKNPIQFCP